MTDDTLYPGDPDELLLSELRRVAALLDPMPDRLVHAGRDSLTWRSVDAELAALLSDSAVEDERAALVRSTAGLRAVAFESSTLTIELDVLVDGPRRTLVGQLVPAAPAAVEVQTAELRTTVAADAQGMFRLENVPAGQMRLRVTGHPAGDSPTETSWITI
jgi:hypothetical protein